MGIARIEFVNHTFKGGFSLGIALLPDDSEVAVIATTNENARLTRVPFDEAIAYREFAEIASAEAALAFANRFGLLGVGRADFTLIEVNEEQRNAEPAETVEDWLNAAAYMRVAVELWDLVSRRKTHKASIQKLTAHFMNLPIFPAVEPGVPPQAFDKRDEEFLIRDWQHGDVRRAARRVLGVLATSRLRTLEVVPTLALTDEKNLSVVMRPPTLLAALWLQFAEAISAKRQYRPCDGCGKLLELSLQEFRTNRRTCSDACRSKVYRQRKAATRSITKRRLQADNKSRHR